MDHTTRSGNPAGVEIHPLTPDHWEDLEALFGPRGPVDGCWCMDRRLRRSVYMAGRGDENRRRLRELTAGSRPPGLIAFVNGTPAGWVAVGPRSDFPVMDRSVVVRGLEDLADWVVACLFVSRAHRRSGLGTELLRAAVEFSREFDAVRIEGYPVDTAGRETPDVFAFTGIASQFAAAGFEEVARQRPTRPIMRRPVRSPPSSGSE